MKSRSSPGNPHGHVWVVLAAAFFWPAMVCPSGAMTYYVDANHPGARDSNPGTEALPFLTIGKAASLVNAGDAVLIKGGVYRETVTLSRSGTATSHTGRGGTTTTTSPITFMACPGHEGKVIINAAEPVTDWHPCAGPQECAGNPDWEHIVWADVSALVQAHPKSTFAVRQVFQHGKLLPRSRYPNTGWRYPTSMPDPTRTFIDRGLSQPPGYFTGAICHIKTAVWRIESISIADFSRGTITLAGSPWYEITERFGYYITSIVGEINAEGEWAYDPVQQKIFLWPQEDEAAGVEFSYREYCLRTNTGTAWNVVRGLTMRHAHRAGIWLEQSHNMCIEDNTIEYPFTYGIHLQSTYGPCDDNQILRNTIRYCGYSGINVGGQAARNNIEGNYVYATGTDTFAGDLLNGQTQAIYIGGPYTRVYNNRVDRCGYAGLYLSGPTLGRDISYNYVTNVGLALADAGGLYTGSYSDGPEKDHIHHNIVVDAIGCFSMDRDHDNGRAPTISTHSGTMHGIYVDEEGNNRMIEHNTAINCSMSGILLHWAPANVVQNNTLYGNRVCQVAFSGRNETRKTLVDEVLLDNILFATSAEQKTLRLSMNYDNVRFGQSDRNYLYNPYSSLHIFVRRHIQDIGETDEDLTLDGWRILSGYDANSREFSCLEQLNTVGLANPRESRIVYNPTLEAATIDLDGQRYCDVQGNPVSEAVILEPFASKVLIALDPNLPNHTESGIF